MNKIRLSKKTAVFIGVMVIIIFCLPYFLLGDSSFITIHDFLDLTVGHLNNITRNNLFFSFTGEVPLMDGVSRMSIPYTCPLELKNILYYLMPGYWGIVGNLIIVKICAFLGMFLLSQQYIIKNNLWLCLFVALLFSFIPFYIDYSFSSAGIPLLLYSLLNLYNKRWKTTSYLIVLMFAFNSSLSLSGLFVCFLLFLSLIFLFVKEKRVNKQLLIALCVLSFIYIATNWEVISGVFISSSLSNRVEMKNHLSSVDLAMMAFTRLTTGLYHAGSFTAWPIVILFFITYLIYKKTDDKLFVYVMSFVVLSSFIIIGVFSKLTPLQICTAFQFDRFYFLYPSLCFILLAKTFDVLNLNSNRILLTISAIISTLITVSANDFEYKENIKRLFKITNYNQPSYSQFYDEKLFGIVAKDLDIKQDYTTKVVSLDLFPSVLEYNGFWCLDGYVSTYSLDYKHKFRKVISKELDKDNVLKSYFDDWGNRCYVFSAELFKHGTELCGKTDDISVNFLDINTKALRNLGCQYVLSSVDIKNYKELNWTYINSYTTDQSYWNIKVYKLN